MKTQRTVYTANLLLVAFAISAAIAQESDVHVIMPNSYRASCPSNLLRTI